MFGSNLKDIVSNIAALVVAVATALQQVMATQNGASINWLTVIFAIAVAVGLWLNGKNADGSAKTVRQVDAQNDSK